MGKLGDGAFGDVFKAKNRINRNYAAAKIIELTSEEDIEEHATEIDILAKAGFYRRTLYALKSKF